MENIATDQGFQSPTPTQSPPPTSPEPVSGPMPVTPTSPPPTAVPSESGKKTSTLVSVVTVLCLIVIPFIGIIMMWVSTSWNKIIKVALTIVFLIALTLQIIILRLVIINLIGISNGTVVPISGSEQEMMDQLAKEPVPWADSSDTSMEYSSSEKIDQLREDLRSAGKTEAEIDEAVEAVLAAEEYIAPSGQSAGGTESFSYNKSSVRYSFSYPKNLTWEDITESGKGFHVIKHGGDPATRLVQAHFASFMLPKSSIEEAFEYEKSTMSKLEDIQFSSRVKTAPVQNVLTGADDLTSHSLDFTYVDDGDGTMAPEMWEGTTILIPTSSGIIGIHARHKQGEFTDLIPTIMDTLEVKG